MSTYTIRTPQNEDAPRVAELICIIDHALSGDASYNDTLEEVLADWKASEVDLQQDVWLAVAADDTIIGYEIVYDLTSGGPAFAEGYVHPDWQQQGIGSDLLGRAEARVREVQGEQAVLHVACYDNEVAAHDLFRSHGYHLNRHFWRMVIEQTTIPEAPTWPTGLEVRPFDLSQVEHVYQAQQDSFADHWGFTPTPIAMWKEYRIDERFDPELWVVVWDADQVAGFAICRQRDDMGWISNLGVRRPWRQRGLASALLYESFRRFAQRDEMKVGLGVDAANPTGATRIYERAGMQVVHRYDSYEKQLATP